MSDRVIMTREGYEKLKKELEILKQPSAARSLMILPRPERLGT